MNNFTKALYVDLIKRIDHVLKDIRINRPHENIRKGFTDDTINQFQSLRKQLKVSLDQRLFEIDGIIKNIIPKFKIIQRDFKNLHAYRYLPIKNYSEPELFFSLLIDQIYLEHRIDTTPPLVSTISNHNDYYWAAANFEVIALPSGEEKNLLNLPDIYHEIGHLLHYMFLGRSSEKLNQGIGLLFKNKRLRKLHSKKLDYLELVEFYWREYWLEEFTCDLIATYMTGAAYAWTNLKLTITQYNSEKIYEYKYSHPANAARMTAIIMMLEKICQLGEKENVKTWDLPNEKKEVVKMWKQFLKATKKHEPKDYKLIYPTAFLAEIVDEVFAHYQDANLAAYSELENKNSIAETLNKAWRAVRSNPATFHSYENQALNELRQKLEA